MDSPKFPPDIKKRVERLLSACGGQSLGSYTESAGILSIREDVAAYIQQRDGYPADPNDIYLCNGASDGIKTVIKLLMNNNPKRPSGIVRRTSNERFFLERFADDSSASIPVVQRDPVGIRCLSDRILSRRGQQLGVEHRRIGTSLE